MSMCKTQTNQSPSYKEVGLVIFKWTVNRKKNK